MTVTFDAYRRRDKPPARDRSVLEPLARAALSAEAVTGSEDWDLLLSMLEAERAKADAAADAAARQIMDPSLIDHDLMMALKVQALLFRARADTLKAVIDLPAALKRDGAAAKLKLEGLNGQADAG